MSRCYDNCYAHGAHTVCLFVVMLSVNILFGLIYKELNNYCLLPTLYALVAAWLRQFVYVFVGICPVQALGLKE